LEGNLIMAEDNSPPDDVPMYSQPDGSWSPAVDGSKPPEATIKKEQEEPIYSTPVGKLESAGRGALQGVALGYAPQVIAKAKSLFGDSKYENELQKQKVQQEAAWQEHPYLYGTGMVGSAIPAAGAAVVGGPEAALGAGAYGVLSKTANIAELGSGALRAAGVGNGLTPALIRGTSKVLASPFTQGAIYGSAEGEDLKEKAVGAAEGAVGAKIGQKVISGVGNYAGKKLSNLGSSISRILSGDPTLRDVAANSANELNVSLPKASVDDSVLSAVGSTYDISHQVKLAAAKTLGETGEVLSNLGNGVLPEDAGIAVKDSFVNWLYKDSNATLDKIYNPLKSLHEDSSPLPLSNLKDVIAKAKEDPLKKYPQTIKIVQDLENETGLANPEGLDFSLTRRLRALINDNIDHSKLTQDRTLDQDLLKEMANALTKDMKDAAYYHGGEPLESVFVNADKEAQKIYQLRSEFAKKIGIGLPQDRPESGVFSNLAKMANVKTGDVSTLNSLKNIVSPEAWQSFSNAYINNLMPKDRFYFGGFMKNWNGIDPRAKDLIFGTTGTETRDKLEHIATLGKSAGVQLDAYGLKAPEASFGENAQMAGAVLETAMSGGIPLKAIASMLGTRYLGSRGAENVAGALPKDIWEGLPKSVIERIINPTGKALSSIEKIALQSAKPAAGIAGAELAGKYSDPAYRGALLHGTNKFNQNQSTGGRIGRASGGRAVNHADMAEKLVRQAERVKKVQGEGTEALLDHQDDAIVSALEIANRHI
jgi:hypothetical protein